MKPSTSNNLPAVSTGMRLEWRVKALRPKSGDLTTTRSHSQCLVAADGKEIATIAKDAVADVRRRLARPVRRLSP